MSEWIWMRKSQASRTRWKRRPGVLAAELALPFDAADDDAINVVFLRDEEHHDTHARKKGKKRAQSQFSLL